VPEIDPLHEHVHGHDRPPARRRTEHGRVVADGHLEPWIGRQAGDQRRDEFGLIGHRFSTRHRTAASRGTSQ
jgi:hypothetical protein